ncbi:uncharacterized protein LOC117608408 isoform X1 [Osmia lignaria lignaria]|uniref:uncharacterized protein LOC117608408 isoform X1 n=1 Tax=Osmia lignaria lignaria TaxID=1437193 RepID=UPI00402BA620
MSVRQKELIVNGNKSEVENKIKKIDNGSEGFVAPDGGWGWIIVMAAGFSNFCTFPVLQCFGLIFRDRFAELGINSSQITTILNINCTVTSCLGLANGPLFRKFSCRQVAFVGALVCAISITILSTMTTFTGSIIFFSILYGAGLGITMSSNSLALNTYFKKKRRIATGLSWTCTGMGPIVMPQIITQLIPLYGVTGTVLIFGSFAFNAVVCALLLQPVHWHVKKEKDIDKLNNSTNVESQGLPLPDQETTENPRQNRENNIQSTSKSLEDIGENTQSNLNLSRGKFGSQYLYYDDEEDGPSGIDVMEPGTPMMSRANDGWFSRRHTSTPSIVSKASRKENSSMNSRLSMDLSRQSNLNAGSSVSNLTRQNSETEKSRRRISSYQKSMVPLIIVNESNEQSEDVEHCKDPSCNDKLEQKPVIIEEVETDQLIRNEYTEEKTKKTFLEAIIIFFDLDLLRDLVYVNILLGMTFANFTELNFSLLTPFILGEYGYSKIQVATYMSLLAGVDVGTRLIIPFVADFIGWQNRTFFLVGVCGIAAGRIVLAHVQNYEVTLAVAILIGIGKALRTVFVALVISSHVPLSRLPGATGIQLLTSGIVFLTLGPIVGWIRDVTSNYTIMLHCLNLFTYLTTISWLLEIYFVKRKSEKLMEKKRNTK